MPPSKSPWTPQMYARLHAGTTYLIFGFAVLAFYLFIMGMLEYGAMGWIPLIANILCIVGLAKVRSVFWDLMKVSGYNPVVHDQQEEWRASSKVQDDQKVDSSSPWNAVTHTSASKSAAKVQSASATRSSAQAKKREPSWVTTVNWEEWVGQKLLQKLGIVIVLIGMLVFLKYSFDNRWIEELGRIVLSAVAAGVLIVLGELFHKKYGAWSHAFTGGGLALLYFTVWVAHVLYEVPLAENYGIVVPASMALVLYSFITLVGAIAAVRYNAQTIAWFTVLGGYVTPFLISAPGDGRMALLIYLAILAGGLMLLAWNQKWRYINFAAFLLTQFYLFTSVYMAVPEFGDVEQVITATAFFLLFNILPLLYQFRLKVKTDALDIGLIILNGVAVFLPVVDAFGGWQGGYVGIVCLALAAFYVLFAAAALNNRGEDDSLVGVFLVGTVVLIAGALLAELETEWVAAGWAPFSALLVLVSARLKRMGPWVCAYILLLGSLVFLGINLPVFTAGPESIWHPFTSNWAIQSYVVGASVIAWLLSARSIPDTMIATQSRVLLWNALHGMIAAIAFLGVTFESTRLVFTVDLTWTFAYVLFAVVAIGLFFATESIVWFASALAVQLIALLFIFVLGDQSGLNTFDSTLTQPFVHPWAFVSVFTFMASLLMIYVAKLKSHKLHAGIPVHYLITGIALAQIWVHVSVEITNLKKAYGLEDLLYDRMLSGWWIIFALAILIAGIVKKSNLVRQIALGLLVIPFIHDHISVVNETDRMLETIVWTLLSLGLSIVGARIKDRTLLVGGVAFLGFTAGIDMLAHLGDATAGLLRSSWWALVGLLVMVAGFMEQEQLLRKAAMVLFGATAVKLLIVDFSTLETPVRIGASIATGLLMIGASYLYQRFDSTVTTKH